MGFPALALTDHGTVGGWVKMIAECNRKKDKKGNQLVHPDTKQPLATIKPLIGCEFYFARNHAFKDILGQPDGRKGNRHLILTARNWEGYQNLCRLSEKSWIDGFYHNPRIDIEQLAAHSKGLICQSACLSSLINALILNDKYQEAKRVATIFKDIFGPYFFLEVMYHGIDAERMIIPDIIKLGAELGIPVIATNDVHYILKEMAKSQEALMCISTSKCILDPKRIKFPYDEFYLKSAEEMGKIFGHYPSLLTNTVALAEMVDADNIEKNMGGMRLPAYKVPTPFQSPQEYLEHLAWVGMKKLGWNSSAKHIEALKKELFDVQVAKDVNNYDFATYFLMKWDMIDFARKEKILTGCGRGSGYASVLLRTLGITYGPDPIKYGLLWERFLGFDDKQFYLASDFGIEVQMPDQIDLAEQADLLEEEEEDAMDEVRMVEDDPGGVDRY